MREHLFMPDTQVRPGVPINHLNALGNYTLHKRPEVIVCAGDFADMHGLSSYDKGTFKGEGQRVQEDIDAATHAMEVFFEPIDKHNAGLRGKRSKLRYQPELYLTLGNHENRINRYTNANPELQDFLSTDSLQYQKFGWQVSEFLEIIEVDGILYCHYFPRNANGQIMQTKRGAPNARLQVQREGQSCTAGHQQGYSFHVQQRRDRLDLGLIAGSFYDHEEDYLSPQGTAYWRGIVYKHEVHDGVYDPMFVSMKYLLDNWWDGVERHAGERS